MVKIMVILRINYNNWYFFRRQSSDFHEITTHKEDLQKYLPRSLGKSKKILNDKFTYI